jgi:DNA sulfur modification protein DndC
MNKLDTTTANIKNLFSQGWIVTVGLSGKDSFCVAHCAIEALKQAKAENANVSSLHLVTTDTTLDNFEVHGFLRELHGAAMDYAKEHDLPVLTKFLRPSLSSTPMVEYIGRGKLLRTPQTTRNGRSCAVDWKITPMIKYLREIKATYQTDKVVSLSGSRSEESVIRAANIEKRGETINTIASTEMGYTMAPIKDWTVNEVWSLVGKIEGEQIDSFAENQAKGLRKHYSAGNSGICDIFAGQNKAADKACGARFGCVLCSLVPKDKSLEQQIATDEKQYGYMRPFVDLRTFMNNTLHDMERSRSLVGRQINKEGWLKVNYNQYSMQYRQELLRYVLTIDVRERETAEDLGLDPRFQMITEQALVAIQYHWAREGGEKQVGEAMRMWNDVYIEGSRYDFKAADLAEVASSDEAIKAGRFLSGDKRGTDRFLHLDTFISSMTKGQGFHAEGLAVHDTYYDQTQGMIIPIEDGECVRVMNVKEGSAFNVPELKADVFVNDTFMDMLNDGGLEGQDPTELLKLMLHHGVIELRRGSMKRLHQEAKRAQAINAMQRSGVYFETLYLAYSVTAAERETVQLDLNAKQPRQEMQMGLFA